jgi:hypothetical protein
MKNFKYPVYQCNSSEIRKQKTKKKKKKKKYVKLQSLENSILRILLNTLYFEIYACMRLSFKIKDTFRKYFIYISVRSYFRRVNKNVMGRLVRNVVELSRRKVCVIHFTRSFVKSKRT